MKEQPLFVYFVEFDGPLLHGYLIISAPNLKAAQSYVDAWLMQWDYKPEEFKTALTRVYTSEPGVRAGTSTKKEQGNEG